MRTVVIVTALALWSGPAVAKGLHLDPPTMTTQQERCEPRQRDLCQGLVGERAVNQDLRCDACTTDGASVPAELAAPSPRDTPQRPAAKPMRLRRGPDCRPRSNSPDDPCAVLPPLDTLPRP